MVDSLGIIEAELTRARQAHNEAIAALQRNGAPLDAPDFGEWVLEYVDLQRAIGTLAAPTMA